MSRRKSSPDLPIEMFDPLRERIEELEQEVARRERLERQRTCTHSNRIDVTSYGHTGRRMLCADCGLSIRGNDL